MKNIKLAIASVILSLAATGCSTAPTGSNNLSTLNDTGATGYVLNDYCAASYTARGMADSHINTECMRPAGQIGN